MRISINRDDMPEGDDLKPYQRDIPEGWRDMRIKAAQADRWSRGETHILSVTLVDDEVRAEFDEKFNTDEARALLRLADLAEACGLAADDLDTDDLVGCQVRVRVKHGGKRDNPPYHWINAVAYRPLHAAPEVPPAEQLDGLQF